jgi:crotonobetainyl-CoA:carnitine CoA-transferase CaiB-like acyl-CoA transferase
VLLEGLRVVELGVWVAGPGAGGVLADWGADVVKVEPPEGDPMRKLFAAYAGIEVAGNPPFDLDNRGKRSVVLDLMSEEGKDAIDKLLATTDVFLSNLRPDALERMGLGHAELLTRFPRLVYASVTGFGLEGAERDRAAYDLGAFWARTGIPHLLVPKGNDPPGIRGGLGDHVTGLATVAGILAALRERDRTGVGQLVSTSLLRTGIYCVGWDIGIQLRYERLQSTRGRTFAPNPLINSYKCGDDKWLFLIGLESSRHWPKLVAALGHDDWLTDERFVDAVSRAKNCEALIGLIDADLGTASRDEWAKRFDEHDVWWAPVQTPAEVVQDEQAIAAGAFVDVPDGRGGTFRAVATPVTFGNGEARPRGPVPALGQHTEEVLAELDAT